MAVKNYLDLTGLSYFKSLAIIDYTDAVTHDAFVACNANEVAISGVTYYERKDANSGRYIFEEKLDIEIGASVSGLYKKADPTQSALSIQATQDELEAQAEAIGEIIDGKVSSVRYDSTNKKLKYTNGGDHDIVTLATLKSEMALNNVENKSSETIRSEITSKNVTDALGFTPGTGDVDSVKITAGNGLVSSNSTAQTGAAEVNISLNNFYGDTVNPYAAKNINTVLAGPASGTSDRPVFRALTAADIPSLTTDKITGLSTVASTGSYTDLINTPDIPDTSDFYNKTQIDEKLVLKANDADLATVAKTGSYTDLIDQPTIPTKVSDLTNDAGYTTNVGTITGITMNGSSKGTSGVINLGTVITEHQDISGKANTADLATVATSGSYNDLANKPTIPTAGSTATAVSTSASGGSASTFSKSDHVHSIDISAGDANGQIKIAGANIGVTGLKSAAYTESSAYATSAQGTKADNALPKTDVVNNVATADVNKALSANMGKELNDRIDNLASRGRYLSQWDCETGLAMTEPTVNPYAYKTGDYFIVGNVGTAPHKIPTGTSYDKTVPSTATSTEEIAVDDTFLYDGTTWHLQINHGKSVSFANLSGQPSENANLASALNAKANAAITLAGYGITDAKIENGTITLGSNTITPITEHQSLTSYVPTSRTVNGRALSSNITLAAEDISGFADVATSGDYNDLDNTPTIPTVNNSSVTLTQNGTTLGSFTLNKNTDTTIDIPGGGLTEVDWSDITNKPSTFAPSSHTQAYTTLTGSGTTENQAIVSSGAVNGWTLKTLGPNAFNNTTIPTTYAGSSSAGGAANSVAQKLTLKIKTGTTEGTDLYTFNGSTAKTLDIKQGSNITLTATAGTLTIAAAGYTLPTASTSALGGIKVGSGLSITSDGTLSTSGGGSDVAKPAITNNFTAAQTFSSNGAVISESTMGAGAINVTFGGIIAQSGIKSMSGVYNAVWNDLADCIEVDCEVEPGYCYCFDGEHYYKSNSYMDMGFIGIHSDTAGFVMGSKGRTTELNVAVAGFVLAYVDKEYKPGTPLTCGPDGRLTEISKQDKIENPELVVATYWKSEDEKYWGSEDRKVLVNGRKWVKIK